ncbi:PhzF family phenazine biosynthesis isomerase [Pelotomaculum isophthalicicum JI]|uniref:PhzF family phenazine biosynthesis isomerase n=1 Tax=Pelotomaculum isophthalicicum JI TaxID=947010 RepID=A0A9X4H3C7_9FIRM|nr:PhzF family phenazine biosynthesis isomerase [Pelotomaculum isophthalicicum JI]
MGNGQTLSTDQMLAIARQHKGFVSEVIYCSESSSADYKLIYYSSECEVDFCGHGTIACMYSLIKSIAELMEKSELVIETNNKGNLIVYNRISEQDAVFITAPEPKHIGTDLPSEIIAQNLKLRSEQICNQYPIDIIDAGLRTLIVPLTALKDEVNVYPHEQQLKNFCLDHDIDIILIFTKEVQSTQNIAHTRVFAPRFGYLEDPATGSGNSAFGYYMIKNKLWDGTGTSIEQGNTGMEFNIVKLITLDGKILFGGRATERIIGKYLI